jgi:hypothetical protein
VAAEEPQLHQGRTIGHSSLGAELATGSGSPLVRAPTVVHAPGGSRMSAVGKILGVDSRNKRHFAFTESNLQKRRQQRFRKPYPPTRPNYPLYRAKRVRQLLDKPRAKEMCEQRGLEHLGLRQPLATLRRTRRAGHPRRRQALSPVACSRGKCSARRCATS